MLLWYEDNICDMIGMFDIKDLKVREVKVMKKGLSITGALLMAALLMAGCSNTSQKDTQATSAVVKETSSEAETASAGETSAETAVTEDESMEAAELEQPAQALVNPNVEIEIQDYGTIILELDSEQAPITVANFVKLANEGFYDGLTFHRIIEGFMMQGGDPQGTGMGGSDETIKGEFTSNGVDNKLSNTRGAIAMARSRSMDSASSQFFIVHQDSLMLDGDYAVFGYVTEGMDVVDAICADAKPVDNNGTIAKENQPVITAVRIIPISNN